MNKYQHALSLYNQGDYEEAFDLLYGETDKESLLLKDACRKSIKDQYVYLIRGALDQKEYAKARHLKETYLSKFGQDITINAFQIPDEALASALKEEILFDNIQEIVYPLNKKSNKNRIFLFVLIGFLIFFFFLVLYISNPNVCKRGTTKEMNETSSIIETETKSVTDMKLLLDGNKKGKPITMELTINAEGEIKGTYTDVLNNFCFTLEGKEVAGDLEIKGSNRNLMFECKLSRISMFGYQGYIQVFEDYEDKNLSDKISVYLSNCFTDEDQYQLKSLTNRWNDKHTLQESDLAELKSLYTDQCFFYGQDLNAAECVLLIKQIIEKYDTYSQKLIGDISFIVWGEGLVKCTFTKRVTVNGKSKDYEAYLIFEKKEGRWLIHTESDKVTDAYFERLRKKSK